MNRNQTQRARTSAEVTPAPSGRLRRREVAVDLGRLAVAVRCAGAGAGGQFLWNGFLGSFRG